MIGYQEVFEFTNDVGSFTVHAHAEEHPSGYGNGTLLVFGVDSDFPCERRMSFDVRYEQEDMPALARRVLKDRFGV